MKKRILKGLLAILYVLFSPNIMMADDIDKKIDLCIDKGSDFCEDIIAPIRRACLMQDKKACLKQHVFKYKLNQRLKEQCDEYVSYDYKLKKYVVNEGKAYNNSCERVASNSMKSIYHLERSYVHYNKMSCYANNSNCYSLAAEYIAEYIAEYNRAPRSIEMLKEIEEFLTLACNDYKKTKTPAKNKKSCDDLEKLKQFIKNQNKEK
jgi:hypothetical protein